MTEEAAQIEVVADAAPAAVDAPLMAAADAAPVTAPTRPDGLPDTYWDDAAGVKPEAYSRLAELEAAEEARRSGLPGSPEKYELKLAEEIVGLDGKPVEFDATDPLAQAVLPVLHKHGVGQEGLSELLGAFTKLEVEAAKAESAHIAAEREKLGAEHVKRTSAIHSTITAAIGADGADAIRSQMRSADAVIALEKLVSKVTGAAISAGPPATPDSDLDGLSGEQLLTALRARKAG